MTDRIIPANVGGLPATDWVAAKADAGVRAVVNAYAPALNCTFATNQNAQTTGVTNA